MKDPLLLFEKDLENSAPLFELVGDGRTTLRSIAKYKTLEEIYSSFGESLPALPSLQQQDFEMRVDRFRKYLEKLYAINPSRS